MFCNTARTLEPSPAPSCPPPEAWTTNYTATNFYLQVLEPGAVPLLLLEPQIFSENSMRFLIGTVNGESYTVQQNTNLESTNWTFYTNVIGQGVQYPIISIDTNLPQQFFRVVEP
jgi:hypothetical protein